MMARFNISRREIYTVAYGPRYLKIQLAVDFLLVIIVLSL